MPRPDHAYPLGMPDMMFVSRANLEPVLRRNVRNVYPEIEFLSGAVVGVKPNKLDKRRIGSVSYRLNNEDESREQEVILFIGSSVRSRIDDCLIHNLAQIVLVQ